MVTPFSGEKHTMWLYFLPFSLENRNWLIRRLRRGVQENIAILNLTSFVVFKSFPTMKSVDLISKQMCGQSGK